MERMEDGIIEESLERELKKEALVIYAEIMKKPEVSEAFAILDRLPENLRYHNRDHTEDVVMEAIIFALADGANRETIEQQAISAAWHDVGFVEQYQKNEPNAVKLFEQSEAYKTLPQVVKDEVIANILDTQVQVKDGNPFLVHERSNNFYILDADVSNFGREDFFEKRMKIAEEMGVNLADPVTKKGFYGFVLNLLKNHDWETSGARMLRQTQKEKNIRHAEEEYADLLAQEAKQEEQREEELMY